MALLGMAVYSTAENKKDDCLHKTLSSLSETVDWKRHRLMLSVNAFTDTTLDLLKYYSWIIEEVIFNEGNIGTSRALNRVWRKRKPDEHCIKIDDDVVIHSAGWVEEMEEAIRRMPTIGILGLKRKDVIQSTWHPDPNYRSKLIMLPHEPGERWITFEQTSDIIGTCTLFNSALMDKTGYSWQPGLYGFEDVLHCHRSHLAGFVNGFLNHINIDHIDPGGNEYTTWKEKASGEKVQEMIAVFRDYVSGKRSIYEPFY